MPPVDDAAPVVRVVERTRLRVVAGLLTVAGLFAILMLAAALQGVPTFSVAPSDDDAAVPTVAPMPQPTETGVPEVPPTDPVLMTIVGVIVAAVIGAAVVLLLFLGVRMLVRVLAELWRSRPLAVREAAPVGSTAAAVPVVIREPDGHTIRRGISAALRAIDRGSNAGEGIIAAWVGLEESAAEAGLLRGVSETPAEFTARILAWRDGVGDEVTQLLRLYEDARFGASVAGPAERDAAVRCLRAIEEGWR
ncbi:DUF4129 domain-containing protein [Streptomyces sp. AC495_CC817]|uniref:DUF4129 domain-containing protein n=1 Tax=Streptomyces sp. AC495_CC817 TaxID=2823900 RepID=UPI001C274A8B|nr:DUF4129 domain-containing protein [Streptomyces sp. AC495_CC817]